MMPVLESELRAHGVHVVVAFRGELDLATCPQAEEELHRAEVLAPAVLILDLRPLQFMDSNGARILIDAHRRALAAGRRLAVVTGTGEPCRVIELLGLQKHLQLIDDPSEIVGSDGAGRRG